MHGRKRHGINKLNKRGPRPRNLSYSKIYERQNFSKPTALKNQRKSNNYRPKVPIIQKNKVSTKNSNKSDNKQNKDKSSPSKKYESIEMKIKDIQDKISQQIQIRKKYLKKNIIDDSACFTDDEGYFKLRDEFLDYLLKNAEYNFLERIRTKKRLKNIRFNLESGKEDVLIYEKGIIFSGSNSIESLLDKRSAEWNKWKDVIDLIAENIENYKFFLKKNELDNLYEEYERISLPKKKNEFLICEKCGSENSPKAVFCHYCGQELNNELSDKVLWD